MYVFPLKTDSLEDLHTDDKKYKYGSKLAPVTISCKHSSKLFVPYIWRGISSLDHMIQLLKEDS